MEKRKGLITSSEFTDKMLEIINFIKFNIYIISPHSGPGIGFDFENFDEEKIKRKNFETSLRKLIEKEIKRHYNIIPG
jgi:hypothetical protein